MSIVLMNYYTYLFLVSFIVYSRYFHLKTVDLKRPTDSFFFFRKPSIIKRSINDLDDICSHNLQTYFDRDYYRYFLYTKNLILVEPIIDAPVLGVGKLDFVALIKIDVIPPLILSFILFFAKVEGVLPHSLS